MPPAPRVRFAPSPTGYLHVGSGHSALANWLVARRTGGQFLLRIEDTDAERNRPELIDNVLEMLRWLGLDWDGEPVFQSERGDLYQDAASKLVAGGHAYYCDCTGEQVQARAKERGGKPGYDGFCRDRGLEAGPGRALRFRVPEEGATGWTDLVRGPVSFEHQNIEDFVVLRSSGAPMFLLANAVDDADMAITHVIRGEDHVNNTPKYLLVQHALGLTSPEAFAHLPLLVNEQRKKLSKRRDDVSMADYRARGFLPFGMVNYLALLGWGAPDGQEIFGSAQEIADLYALEDVNPSPAFFDLKKLAHVNAEQVRRLTRPEFAAVVDGYLADVRGTAEPEREALLAAVDALDGAAGLGADAPGLVQERVRTLDEVAPMVDFLAADGLVEPDEASWTKAITKGKNVAEMVDATIERLAALDAAAWTAPAIREAVEAAAVAAGLVNAEGQAQLSKAQGPVRVAISGRTVGPPLFESIQVLGPERTLARLRATRSRLG